jgi:hypothetical protein
MFNGALGTFDFLFNAGLILVALIAFELSPDVKAVAAPRSKSRSVSCVVRSYGSCRH